jgi:hypothetical protein
MEPVYLIAPITSLAVVSAFVYRRVYRRQLEDRAAEESVVDMLTQQWGAAFRLVPNERLRAFWKGQLYEGPAVAEYHNHLDDPVVARFLKPEVVNGKVCYRKVQIHLALTTHDRLVVGRNKQRGAGDQEVTPHSEWLPGSEVYFAYDLGLAPGRPVPMENGYRGRTYFCMLGATEGSRLPMWIPEEAAAAISAWRVPPRT